ncbi:Heparin and heparin-sulfate lyase [Candidatus Sulfopaludibacter sp. SbA3]|nr:Heparin and heparin-sulfate lyase [Candidatus Sulfopaludibacter sp. SbA3]
MILRNTLTACLLVLSACRSRTSFDAAWMPVPPPEHPRLYLRARDIPDLERRMVHPVLKPVWERLQQQAARDPATAVELDSIRYLIGKDAALGRRTAAAALRLLQETKFDMRQQDVSRPIGRLMVTGAIVYDWCYPVLTPDQKRAYRVAFLRTAKTLQAGNPPPYGAAITDHYSEYLVMRNLLSAGVAIYDEDPAMYRDAAAQFFRLLAPPRNWWYRGGAYHQGAMYAGTRCGAEMFPLWIFARMGFPGVYDPAQQFVPYWWIYMRRPDGQTLRSGDGQFTTNHFWSLLTASYYKDPYVLADYLAGPAVNSTHRLFDFLWHDPDLSPRPVSELPLSRYMDSPYGWMIARTGWDAESVIAEMKVNVYNFNDHQHSDGGAFQVYYKGPLAIDSGIYEGTDGGYGSPHDTNYNKRTIAHNSLLIYDPAETIRWKRTTGNDGGQAPPNGGEEPGDHGMSGRNRPASLTDVLPPYRTGEVLGHGFGPDARNPAYTYLKGDITQAYSRKVSRVERSFVFLNLAGERVRAALLVFDRVVSTNPAFRKYWLLHSMEQPQIDGTTITVAPQQRGWQGKLVDQVLLPAAAEIAPVGGPGKEFWVFGRNFPSQPPADQNPEDYEVGAWRVEVSPRAAATDDTFLNVMQIMDRAVQPLPVNRVDAGGAVRARIADCTVLFQRDGRRTSQPVTFRSEGQRFLVTDLVEGSWRILRDGAVASEGQAVSKEEGTIWWSGGPGQYRLEKREK